MVSMSTILSTIPFCQSTLSCQPLGTCNSSEACEFAAENILGRETLFFSGKYGCFIVSLIHWIIVFLISWIIDLLLRCFVESLLHCFIDSSAHYFNHSLIRCFIGSMVHWLTDSLLHWLLDPTSDLLINCFVPSSVHWFIGPHNFNTFLLLHLKSFPIGHLLPIIVFLFSKLPPPRGPGTTGGIFFTPLRLKYMYIYIYYRIRF